MKIRVLMFIEYFHPVIGGAEKQVQYLCRYLLSRGVDVSVVTTRWKGLKPFEIIEGIPVYRRFGLYDKLRIPFGMYIRSALKIPQYRYELTNEDFHSLQPSSERGKKRDLVERLIYAAYRSYLLFFELIKYLYLDISIFFFLFRFRKRFDIIHGHVLSRPYVAVAARIGKLFNSKVIVKAGDVKCFTVLSKFRLYKHYLGLLRRSVDALVCINDEIFTKATDLNFDREKLFKIPNGVDVDEFNAASSVCGDKNNLSLGDKKVVTCVGSQGIKRGLDILIEAWREISIVRKDAILLLIGREGDHSQVLRRLVTKYGLGGSILFLDELKDIRSYLRSSDIFVLPSRTEGVSNALLEAMACGLPVISTRVGGAKEIIKNGVNGLLVDPESSTQIRDAVLCLLDDKILCRDLAREARKTMEERYSFNQIARLYIQLYEKVLDVKKSADPAEERLEDSSHLYR